MEQRRPQLLPFHTYNKHREDVPAPFLHPCDVRVHQPTSTPSRYYDGLQNHYPQKQIHRYKNIFSQRPRTTTPRMYSGCQPHSFSTNSISSNEQEYFFDEIEDTNGLDSEYFNENQMTYSKNHVKPPKAEISAKNSSILLDKSLSMPKNQCDWIPELEDPKFSLEDINPAPMKFADDDSEKTTSVSTSPPPLSSIDYSTSNKASDNINGPKPFPVHEDLNCTEDENRKYIPRLFQKCST